MDIIRKIIPSNPINATTKDKIAQSIAHTLEVFGKNYAKYTQLSIVKNKEVEVELNEKRKEVVEKDRKYKTKYYKKKFSDESEVPKIPEIPVKGVSLEVMTQYCTQIYDLGFKPLRPRGKMEPLKSPEIRVEISRYEIRDSDFDPYAVYIVKASKGKITAEKERRFKEFEKLNKAIKKFLPKDAILPEASSKIGVRNLTSSFLQERVTKLNEYLHKLLESPELQENEDFLFFLGLLPSKNPLDDQIFNDAFRRTKYDLHCWGYINFDKSEDAISKLVTREAWWSVRSDVESALPTAEAPRKASKKLAFKIISSMVEVAVPPAWSAAYKASEPVREKVQKVLETVIEMILTKKHEINEQLLEKMKDSFVPIKDALSKILTLALPKVIPPLLKPFSVIYKTYSTKAEPIILESFKKCDKNRLKEGIDVLNQIHVDLVKKLNDEVDKELKNICDSLKGAVTLRLLQDCFNPMNAIGKIIADFIKMVNPLHFGKIAEILFEFKTKLEKCEGNNVDNILTDMERTAKWYILWEYDKIDCARYWLRYHIYNLGLDLDPIADVCFDLGKKLNKQVYKSVMKKFVFKFSDYVWGYSYKKSKNETDEKSWAERVDESFMIAYNCAKKKFNKECGNIIKDCVCDILKGMILTNVIKEIQEVVKPVIEKVASIIPENIKEMIDIEEMTDKDIEESLEKTFEKGVEEQEEPFVKLLEQVIEECQI